MTISNLFSKFSWSLIINIWIFASSTDLEFNSLKNLGFLKFIKLRQHFTVDVLNLISIFACIHVLSFQYKTCCNLVKYWESANNYQFYGPFNSWIVHLWSECFRTKIFCWTYLTWYYSHIIIHVHCIFMAFSFHMVLEFHFSSCNVISYFHIST